MRARDNTAKIEQLNRAKSGYVASIANMQATSDADGVDRSGAIASENRCIASIEKQIADLTPKPEPNKEPIPIAEISKPSAPESSSTK